MGKIEKRVTVILERRGKGNRIFRTGYGNLSKRDVEDKLVQLYYSGCPKSEVFNEDYFRQMGDALFEERARYEDIKRGEKEIDLISAKKRDKLYNATCVDLEDDYSLFKETVFHMIKGEENARENFLSQEALANIRILPTIQLIALKEMFKEFHKDGDFPFKAEGDYIRAINLTLAKKGFLKYDYEAAEIAQKFLGNKKAFKKAKMVTPERRALFSVYAKLEDLSLEVNQDLLEQQDDTSTALDVNQLLAINAMSRKQNLAMFTRQSLSKEDIEELSLIGLDQLLGASAHSKGRYLEEVTRQIGDRVYYRIKEKNALKAQDSNDTSERE